MSVLKNFRPAGAFAAAVLAIAPSAQAHTDQVAENCPPQQSIWLKPWIDIAQFAATGFLLAHDAHIIVSAHSKNPRPMGKTEKALAEFSYRLGEMTAPVPDDVAHKKSLKTCLSGSPRQVNGSRRMHGF